MELTYTLRISPKAHRYHLEIDWENGLVVVVPRRWNQQIVNQLLEEKKWWIDKHLAKIHREKQIDKDEVIQTHNYSEREIREIFDRESAYWAKIIGVEYNRIALRTQKTKWGSCSSMGNLNFHKGLMLAPAGVREYVVIHELCHLRERNHSQRFWTLVEKHCPDFRIPRKWLRQNGRILANHAAIVHR